MELLESYRDLLNEGQMQLEQEQAVGNEESEETPPTLCQLTTKQLSRGFFIF